MLFQQLHVRTRTMLDTSRVTHSIVWGEPERCAELETVLDEIRGTYLLVEADASQQLESPANLCLP